MTDQEMLELVRSVVDNDMELTESHFTKEHENYGWVDLFACQTPECRHEGRNIGLDLRCSGCLIGFQAYYTMGVPPEDERFWLSGRPFSSVDRQKVLGMLVDELRSRGASATVSPLPRIVSEVQSNPI